MSTITQGTELDGPSQIASGRSPSTSAIPARATSDEMAEAREFLEGHDLFLIADYKLASDEERAETVADMIERSMWPDVSPVALAAVLGQKAARMSDDRAYRISRGGF